MRPIHSIVPGLLAALISGQVLAEAGSQTLRQEIERRATLMDSDGDGVVTRQEYLANAGRQFSLMDADGDGRITAAERDRIAATLGALSARR